MGPSPWAEGMGTAGGQGTGGPQRGKLAAGAGGSGVAPDSHLSHLCLLFFRDPDSDLRDEEEAEMKETRWASQWGAKAGQPQEMGTRAGGWPRDGLLDGSCCEEVMAP